jgi:hypothetical protein
VVLKFVRRTTNLHCVDDLSPRPEVPRSLRSTSAAARRDAPSSSRPEELDPLQSSSTSTSFPWTFTGKLRTLRQLADQRLCRF